MDVHPNHHAAAAQSTTLGFDRLAQLLGRWQAGELRTARGFPECRGLSDAQLEDVYQDTALALLSRSYGTEEHLRNALRHGIRHRALNAHRDQRRRREILAEHAPAIHRTAQAGQKSPEDAVLAEQDRLIAKEFLADLDDLERAAFELTAGGHRYRAIATALDIPANQARAAARSCERKRARFQLLYETGRLCGYRAGTIQALSEGAASARVERQARAHLAACATCRAKSPGGTRRLGMLAGVVGSALPAGSKWLRRVIGTGGVTAKATAVALTGAVVASSILSGPRHAAPGTRARAGDGHRAVLPTRRREQRELAAVAPSSSIATDAARRPPRPRRLVTGTWRAGFNVAGLKPGSAQSPTESAGEAAVREFGPEDR
ncbi:MAG: RNA polymerase sigma factor [Solirubrobacteraceae bacterium]